MQREMRRIYEASEEDTRQVYDMGVDNNDAVSERWIIRWLIWHVLETTNPSILQTTSEDTGLGPHESTFGDGQLNGVS